MIFAKSEHQFTMSRYYQVYLSSTMIDRRLLYQKYIFTEERCDKIKSIKGKIFASVCAYLHMTTIDAIMVSRYSTKAFYSLQLTKTDNSKPGTVATSVTLGFTLSGWRIIMILMPSWITQIIFGQAGLQIEGLLTQQHSWCHSL